MFKFNSHPKKITIYTAIFNDYDTLKDQELNEDCNFVCFTDNKNLSSDSWKIVKVKREAKCPIREARKYKILSHKYLPKEKFVVWIDASARIKNKDFTSVVRESLKICDINTIEHYCNDNVYEELKRCLESKKDCPKTMKKQVEAYKELGLPDNTGMVATGAIIRKNSRKVRKFNEAWHAELVKGSRRDQLSFNYISWKLGITYNCFDKMYIDSDKGVLATKNLDFYPHK